MTLQRIALFQIGVGVVGAEVINQVTANRAWWRDRFGLDLRYAAIGTTAGAVMASDANGLDAETLAAVVQNRRSRAAAPAAGLDWRALSDIPVPFPDADRAIVIDVAAGDRTAPVLAAALANGAEAVLANKAPLALPAADPVSQTLWRAAADGRLRYEATCGAGLPVISTLSTLLATGDSVIASQGLLSGTLGAIFTSVGAGSSFSAAVHDAKARGFTEPDPRDDLSGLDVARKALILARTMGRAVDLTDIAIENLTPEPLRAVPVDEFLARVNEGDAPLAARAAAATANGRCLKYLATVPGEGPIAVGVSEVGQDSLIGALQGPENIVIFRTARYDAHPLTVVGPGAGAAVTAAGVLGDVLALAHTRR